MNEDHFKKSDLAIKLDISRPTLDKLLEGVEPARIEGRHKLYSLTAVQAVIEARKREQEKGKASSEARDYKQAQARKAFAQAEKLELEVARLKGEVLPVEEIVSILADPLLTIRSRLLSLPTKAAPQLINISNQFEVKELLSKYVSECLDELSQIPIGLQPGKTESNPTTETTVPAVEATNQTDSQPMGGSQPPLIP